MRARHWTLAGRLTQWFVLALAFLILGSIASWWVVRQSVSRELDGLAHEEVDEMVGLFNVSLRSPAEFEAIARRLDAYHPENPMAWRVWNPDGTVWAEHGAPAMLAKSTARPRSQELEITDSIDKAHIRRADVMGDGLVADLVLDGSAQWGLLHRYQVLGLVLLAVLTVSGVLAGTLLSRRVSSQLRSIAEGLRRVDSPRADAQLEVQNAPEEIRAVVGALESMLETIRRQVEHAQLLTAGLAHELRSPIQNMLGESEVALMSPRSEAEYRQVIESRVEELRDLSRVVDNLVVLCSPQGQRPIETESFDLGEEVGLRIARERDAAQRRGVRLAVQQEGNLRLTGDREAILLAVRNLIGNAIQWSPQGSEVAVHLQGNGRTVAITVDDHGPGVPPDLRQRVFEPFFRGPARNGARVGYGLGLALSRTAVESHGGSIEISDSPAGGARFRIELLRCRTP